MTKYILKVHVC